MTRIILKDEEICRITFEDGDVRRLMKQTYKNDKPFYTVKHGHNFTPVETSNENLSVILSHLRKCSNMDKAYYYNGTHPEEILNAVKPILDKQDEFIEMIEKYLA